MKEKKRIKLEDIKVESFVTSLDEKLCYQILGASADGEICDTEDGVCDTNYETCEVTLTMPPVCSGNTTCPVPSTNCPGTV